MLILKQMGHDIQEWTKSKLRKAAFKKLYMACLDTYIKTVKSSYRMFIKKSLLEIFAKFTENTCAGVSFSSRLLKTWPQDKHFAVNLPTLLFCRKRWDECFWHIHYHRPKVMSYHTILYPNKKHCSDDFTKL